MSEALEISQGERAQAWTYSGALRTVRRGREYFKVEFASQSELECLSAEFKAAGGKGLPSSWGDVYHRLYQSPYVPKSVAFDLRGRVPGGWQEARHKGRILGTWRVYDLKSAYRWAAGLPLPWIRSGEPSERVEGRGIYRLTFTEAGAPTPPTIHPGQVCMLTGDEIASYDLRGVEIISGVNFTRTCSIEKNFTEIERRFTLHKKIFRSFWGAWLATRPVTVQMLERGRVVKLWKAAKPTYNAAWAAFITGRVRRRVSEYAKDAAHIFVDSIMLPYEIREGGSAGDWALQRTINAPTIEGAGRYRDDADYIKNSGRPRIIAKRVAR